MFDMSVSSLTNYGWGVVVLDCEEVDCLYSIPFVVLGGF